MYFNSLDFALFLPVVFFLYWFVTNENLKWQNLLIVFASYLFYGWWDWRFLSLILFSTVVDFSIGLLLQNSEKKKNRLFLLWGSILVNLGFLFFFKYYNFFLDNFITAFSFFGASIKANTLNIILPVGISFYTFQTLSYTIDVYKKKLKPTNDFIAFAAFVSFFPQLVAGPIERATNLLPQFFVKRKFDRENAIDGLRQILWGLFKKVVVADNCAEFANIIFNNAEAYPGSILLLGAIFFTFQIYGDFSGYSDIAIGTSRLLGFKLMQNFAFPYFSRDISEFWRRWHISLSTWFRDYLYIPLGGSRGGQLKKIRNTFAIFLVSGFWHGANWTFIVWGGLNALYFLPLLLTNQNRKNLGVVAAGSVLPSFRDLTNILLTFFLTVIAWIFFRADNLNHAFVYLSNLFSYSLFYLPFLEVKSFGINLVYTLLAILVLISIEWLQREKQHGLEQLKIKSKKWRWFFYYLLIFSILFMNGEEQDFIYFQFYIYKYDNFIETEIGLNTDYVKTEGYLKTPEKYDAFIFGSSRAGMGFNIKDWENALPAESHGFSFTTSNESIYGILGKVKLIDQLGGPLHNVLLVIDADITFQKYKNSKGNLYRKHPKISGESKRSFIFSFMKDYFTSGLFFPYLDYRCFKTHRNYMDKYLKKSPSYEVYQSFETKKLDRLISQNEAAYYAPRMDSIFYKRDALNNPPHTPKIAGLGLNFITEIKGIFDKHQTNYKIIISPLYDQKQINPADLNILKNVFEAEHIYNYSGKNSLTQNHANYYEQSHYRKKIGNLIVQELYPPN